MIVLEGADGSGKSTLAKHLSDVLDKTLWHPGGAVDDDLVKEWMKKCEHKLDQGFLLDRTTHVSEFIYGPIINGREAVTFKEMMAFFRLCIEKRWKIVYCRPSSVLDLNHVKDDHDSNEQIEAVEKHHKRIVQIYDDIFLSSKSDFLRNEDCLFIYDYEQQSSFSQLVQFLKGD